MSTLTDLSNQTVKIYQDHLIMDSQLVVVFDWGDPITVHKSNERYSRIRDLLESGNTHNLADEVDLAFKLQQKISGKFQVVGGLIKIGDALVPEDLSNLILLFVEKGYDTSPLEAFWANLAQNPTESARKDLFAFLKANGNGVGLTRDGCFVVYKKVKSDWYDSYTGKTYLNLPGKTISMPREQVDHDRRNTCSRGLHVAAWGYAHGFSGTRTLMVKVNPRDVVAVPPDYNQQKMRVCQYLVLGETNAPYEGSIYEEATINGRPTSEFEGLDITEVSEDYEDEDY